MRQLLQMSGIPPDRVTLAALMLLAVDVAEQRGVPIPHLIAGLVAVDALTDDEEREELIGGAVH